MNKISIFVAVLTFASCGTHHKSVPQKSNPVERSSSDNKPVETFLVKEENVSKTTYHGSRTIYTDLVHTKLEVSFDWSKSRLNGIATITAKPHFYATDSLILDAKGMDILEVSLADKVLKFNYDSLQLRIKLDKTYSKSENFTVRIKYVSKPEERSTGGSEAITSDKGLYFINPKKEANGKMPQIWTQGETESNSVWFPTIDSPNMKSTEEIYITVENKYTTLSNGKLINSKVNADGTRTDYWKQDLPHAPYLFMLAVGEFKVVKDFYTKSDGSKIEVNYYVEPEWEQDAKAIFGETPAMIAYFSKLLGVDFVWDKYHQIVVRDYVSGAMENTGAVIFGDYVYKTKRELLDENDQSTIAHELFHHWFGDLVTCESWSNLTLNESFANYSQYLWDEYRYGLDEAAYNAESEADGYYQTAQTGGYHNLVWFDYKDREQMFDGHSYNKGGRILHMLRCYVGDEAFFKALNIYLSSNKFKTAEFNQLRIILEDITGEDLNWFFNQWFLGKAHPILDVKQVCDVNTHEVRLTIEQKQNLELAPLFRLPLDVAVYDSKGKHVERIVVDDVTNQFTFQYSGELKCVIVDDQQMLLGKIRYEKPLNQLVFQYYNSKYYKARKESLVQISTFSDSLSQQVVVDALNDSFWALRSMAIGKINGLNAVNKNSAILALKSLVKTDPSSQVRANAAGVLAKSLEVAELESLFTGCLKVEQSYLVINTMLRELGQRDPKFALVKAQEFEKEVSSKMQAGIAQIYQAHGDLEKFSYFQNVLSGRVLKDFDQLSVMNSLTVFLARHGSLDYFEQALKIYSELSIGGESYTKMFLPQNLKYIHSFFDQTIGKLNGEIAEFEKNKDVLYADKARLQVKKCQVLMDKYDMLNKSDETPKLH